ncbi:hypothetical protein D3C86_1834840 [compost metagenome]
MEACTEKYAIFKAIRTWENARAANAFPRWVKKQLADPANQFHLEELDQNTWKLYKTDLDGRNAKPFCVLARPVQ